MHVPVIAEQAELKGLQVLGTADILHEKWFKEVKENTVEVENGVLKHEKFPAFFIPQVEVEDCNRVHHLIFLEDLTRALELKEKLKGKGSFDKVMDGRPRLKLNAEEIAGKVLEVEGLIGPAHAFTPYFGVFAHFDSVKKAFGEFGKEIKFLELGLSADSALADLIEENHNYNFFTFSDSHSPWPFRLGREFSRIKMQKPSFKELQKALDRKEGREITLNVGLNPKEGKYHETACNACFTHYSLQEAKARKWKCSCGGSVKKGVKDRILELAKFTEEVHPSFRPDYVHLLPLAEIIQLTLKVENVQSEKVQKVWKLFVEMFNNEINVLLEEPVVNLIEAHEAVGRNIEAFRKGLVVFEPGGGGQYGKPFIALSERELEEKKLEIEKGSKNGKQKTLLEY